MSRRQGWVVAIAVLALVQLAAAISWRELDRSRQAARFPVVMEPRSEPGHDLLTERPDESAQPIAARSGRYQLIHFWATWCPPCREEIPTLVDLQRRERGRLQVWLITTDVGWGPVRQFFRGAIPPAVVRDTGRGHRAYGVTILPDSYLLDPEGRVVARFAGGQDWHSVAMRGILDRILP